MAPGVCECFPYVTPKFPQHFGVTTACNRSPMRIGLGVDGEACEGNMTVKGEGREPILNTHHVHMWGSPRLPL